MVLALPWWCKRGGTGIRWCWYYWYVVEKNTVAPLIDETVAKVEIPTLLFKYQAREDWRWR